jgi:hypothetical protein
MFTWVYRYRYWDPDRNEIAASADYFTLEAIRAGLGMAIVESGIKVTHDQVDEFGRFRTHSNADTRPYGEGHPLPDRSS